MCGAGFIPDVYTGTNGDHLMKEFIVFCLVTLICPEKLPATESDSVVIKAPGVLRILHTVCA